MRTNQKKKEKYFFLCIFFINSFSTAQTYNIFDNKPVDKSKFSLFKASVDLNSKENRKN